MQFINLFYHIFIKQVDRKTSQYSMSTRIRCPYDFDSKNVANIQIMREVFSAKTY